MWESLQDKSYKLPHLIKTIPHSGKLSRKKTFAVLWLSVSFLHEIWGHGAFWWHQGAIHKVFSAKVLFYINS